MDEHTAKAFDTDLNELSIKVREMARLAERRIADVTEVLGKMDAALAKEIIASDYQIDALQRGIEEKAVLIIAKRQPVAVDLREVVGAMRIANDLERIGDLTKSIAKRVLLSADDFRAHANIILQLQRMAHLVLGQLTRVIQSFEDRDVAAALEVWRKDQEVDALHNSLFRELLTYMMENPRNITFCTHLLFCAKNIERMGDHATNIAETVHYAVLGRMLPEERPKADLTGELAGAKAE